MSRSTGIDRTCTTAHPGSAGAGLPGAGRAHLAYAVCGRTAAQTGRPRVQSEPDHSARPVAPLVCAAVPLDPLVAHAVAFKVQTLEPARVCCIVAHFTIVEQAV
jgi:hypothetical protein